MRPRRWSSISASTPRRQGPRLPHLAEAAASGTQAPTGKSVGRPHPNPRLLRQEQDAGGAPTSHPHQHQQIPPVFLPLSSRAEPGARIPTSPFPGVVAFDRWCLRGRRGGEIEAGVASGGGLGFRPPVARRRRRGGANRFPGYCSIRFPCTLGSAIARQEADKLKKELSQLKTKLKEEDKEKAEAQVQAKEKEDNLRNSIKALLGNPPVDYAADAISFAVNSSELV
ncbi:hypothetical protein QYE76_009359 [Lolium multiflorum]|uniref:Uncharacterized protein n=1 Tax=Lolium multiflorum TaxID=4521 RepID=A0AAD8TTH2_LOLMU|nr:hypothetical protein QYE76_009359 [Lolium multiflorum]